LLGEAALAVALEPIFLAETTAEMRDGVANAMLLGGKPDHARSSRSRCMAAPVRRCKAGPRPAVLPRGASGRRGCGRRSRAPASRSDAADRLRRASPATPVRG